MSNWPDARFRLERFTELGMAIRRKGADAGQGTLLYIHGLGESGLCFERVMTDPRLDPWTHLVPDLIGYGKSVWPEQPFNLERHAAGLDLLMDRLGLEEVTLVGHSMGGVIAGHLAGRQRPRIKALVNVEGNISPADCTGSAIAARHTLEQWLRRGFDRYVDSLCDPTDPDDPMAERSRVLRSYSASARICDPRTFHLNSRDLVRESDTETLAYRLGKLDLPQIYIHGAPRGTGERSRSLLDAEGIARVELSPAGHWPYLDQHDAFVDALLAFLTR